MKRLNFFTVLACLALPIVACTPETPKLIGLDITHLPNKTAYVANEQIDLDGLEVTAKYSNNKTKVVENYTTNVNLIDMSTRGTKEVKVFFKDLSKKFNITVKLPQKEAWTNEEQTLIEQYAGEVLPVPTGMESDAVVEAAEYQTYDYEEEVYVGTGEYYLKISDGAEEFSIEQYYSQFGESWTVLLDEDGNPEQYDEYGLYYQLNKRDGLKVYDLKYYYEEGNIITVESHNLVDTLTDNTEWSEDDAYYFEYIYFTPAFFKAGSDYYLSISDEGYALSIYDSYYQDNVTNFTAAMDADGFAYDIEEGIYSLVTDDGNTLYAAQYFDEFQGNVYCFELEINSQTSTSWPSSFVEEYETACSVEVLPLTGSSYTYYMLAGAYVIEIDVEEDTYYENEFQNYLKLPGVYGNYSLSYWTGQEYYYIRDWDGNFAIDVVTLLDEDYEFAGYQLILSKPEPVVIVPELPAGLLKDVFGVEDLELPNIPDPDDMGIMYEADADYGEIDVVVYDTGTIGTNAIEDLYLATLKEAGWWTDDSEYDSSGYIAEDKSGSIRLTFYTQFNAFFLYVEEGEGEEHPATFELDRESASVKPGASLQLNVVRELVPGEITWASDNPSIGDVDQTGLVTVNPSATAEDTFTVTATCGTYEASCLFKVLDPSVTWRKVTSEAELVAGNQYVMACESKGYINGAISGQYLANEAATFADSEITSEVPEDSILTLGGSEGAWTLSFESGLLGVTAVKKLAIGSGTTTYTISIDSSSYAATIQSTTSSYGRFLYNVNSPRFTTYTSDTSTSMLLPTLYVLG